MSGVISFLQPVPQNKNSEASINFAQPCLVSTEEAACFMWATVPAVERGSRLHLISVCSAAPQTAEAHKCRYSVCVCVWVGFTELFKSRPQFTHLFGSIDFQSESMLHAENMDTFLNAFLKVPFIVVYAGGCLAYNQLNKKACLLYLPPLKTKKKNKAMDIKYYVSLLLWPKTHISIMCVTAFV